MEEKDYFKDEHKKAVELKRRIAAIKKGKKSRVIFCQFRRSRSGTPIIFAGTEKQYSYDIFIFIDDTWEILEKIIVELEKQNVIAISQIHEVVDTIRYS
jgi:hypothetical protein